MFEHLGEVVMRYEELIQELSDPAVLTDQEKYRQRMKEQTELTPLVEKYKEYCAVRSEERRVGKEC